MIKAKGKILTWQITILKHIPLLSFTFNKSGQVVKMYSFGVAKDMAQWHNYNWVDPQIRAVAEQHSLPELRLANKTKMHLKPKQMYEDVLYFDLQPHPMACTLRSVVMEWKQTLNEYFLLTDWCDIYFINHESLWPWPQGQWGGGWWGWNSVEVYTNN